MVAGPQQSEAYSEALVGIKIIPTPPPLLIIPRQKHFSVLIGYDVFDLEW